MKDYYLIIGIDENASQQEIKQAFRKLAVHFHPDKNPEPDAELRFKEINEAYEVLNDPAKRLAYDQQRQFPSGYIRPANHPDPAYRKSPYQYQRPTSSHQSARELMVEYLPKFRWISWAGLFLTITVAFDYLLPHQSGREDIAEINRVFRTGRYGGAIYDHDVIITRQGSEIVIFNDDFLHFKDEPWIVVERTLLFSKVVNASSGSENYVISGTPLYSTLAFMPLFLFLTSLLGVMVRNKVEFPFNLSIVSGIFCIIVLYLIIR